MAMLDWSRHVRDGVLLMLLARIDSVRFFIGTDTYGMLFFAEFVRLLTTHSYIFVPGLPE
jgi:hypothetical protein